MLLPITLTIAGGAALLNIWLAIRVGQLRLRHKVSVGDGGVPAVTARMRAHANFVEYAPLFVLLLALIELAVGSPWWLWLAGALFLVARVLHAFGMDRPAPNPLRGAGIGLTLLLLLGLALYAVALPVIVDRAHRGVDVEGTMA